jgi:hypothetical protein
MKNNNLKKIFYENKLYNINEEEYNHYHADGIPVPIYKNEIIKIPFTKIGYSKYSFKKQEKFVEREILKFGKTLNKIFRRIKI